MWPLAVAWQGRIVGAIMMTLVIVIAVLRLVVVLVDRLVYLTQSYAEGVEES